MRKFITIIVATITIFLFCGCTDSKITNDSVKVTTVSIDEIAGKWIENSSGNDYLIINKDGTFTHFNFHIYQEKIYSLVIITGKVEDNHLIYKKVYQGWNDNIDINESGNYIVPLKEFMSSLKESEWTNLPFSKSMGQIEITSNKTLNIIPETELKKSDPSYQTYIKQ